MANIVLFDIGHARVSILEAYELTTLPIVAEPKYDYGKFLQGDTTQAPCIIDFLCSLLPQSLQVDDYLYYFVIGEDHILFHLYAEIRRQAYAHGLLDSVYDYRFSVVYSTPSGYRAAFPAHRANIAPELGKTYNFMVEADYPHFFLVEERHQDSVEGFDQQLLTDASILRDCVYFSDAYTAVVLARCGVVPVTVVVFECTEDYLRFQALQNDEESSMKSDFTRKSSWSIQGNIQLVSSRSAFEVAAPPGRYDVLIDYYNQSTVEAVDDEFENGDDFYRVLLVRTKN